MSSIHSTEEHTKKRRRLSEKDISEATNDSLQQLKPDEPVKKQRKHTPKFRLKGSTGQLASLSTGKEGRVPLTLTDVQYLLLHSLFGNLNLTQAPRWYVLDKCTHITQTTCLVLEGISSDFWENRSSDFTAVGKLFDDQVEILTPAAYGGSLVDELALVPLSDSEKECLILKYGSMNLALEARKDLNVMMKAVFPISSDENENESVETSDKYPRTQLVLSAWQLIEENYPLPLKGKLQKAYSDYVMTKDEYQPVTPSSPLFGLDCEMCMTNAGSELTRVSIVNEKHETIYESLVKPYNQITDYLTRYSGITKSLLENVTKRIEDIQKEIRELLPPDAILVGQSLNIDLHALKMMHPYVIDTSIVFNLTGERTRKPKLKTLAKELLQEDIQQGKSGHCSTEDSLAALKLVQLKLSKSVEYGDAVHTNREKFKENLLKTVTSEYAISIFNHVIEQKKTSVVIGCDDITGDYHTYLTQAKESPHFKLKKVKPKKVKLLTLDTAQDAITALCESSKDFNFSMAHLKIDINDDTKSSFIKQIDNWVNSIWKSLGHGNLFVLLFGGTANDNGVAMIKVKSSL